MNTQRMAKIRLSQLSFWWFCKVMAPDFYTDDKLYLKEFCDKLQGFYEDKEGNKDILLVNLPPRHGKSRTISLFSNWVFGKDKEQKIIIGSYNAALSTLFSKSVRNCIMEVTQEKERIVYSDIFNTSIKRGDASMNMWSLDGAYASYLATSPTGTVTGMGGTIIIIDDLIKNAYEAYNDMILDNHYEWFTKTMLSRAEKKNNNKPLIIVVGTRWSENDLSGKIESYFPKDRIELFKKPLINHKNEVLSDNVLDLNAALNLKMQIGDDIFNANYQQECSNKKGKLYNINDFNTYVDKPNIFESINCYVDTADEGNDFLCSIIYGKLENKAYILDILYTDEAMEITEVLVSNKMIEFNVDFATIESNNGGRGFARQVERIINEKFGKTKVSSFHQSLNKKARIISNNTFVKNNIFFPKEWVNLYDEFAKEVLNYSTSGKNKHDDGIDTLTGVAEQLQKDFNKHTVKNLSKKDFLGF